MYLQGRKSAQNNVYEKKTTYSIIGPFFFLSKRSNDMQVIRIEGLGCICPRGDDLGGVSLGVYVLGVYVQGECVLGGMSLGGKCPGVSVQGVYVWWRARRGGGGVYTLDSQILN